MSSSSWLPDARLPREAGSVAAALTPDRLLAYLTGEARVTDSDTYAWRGDPPQLAAAIERTDGERYDPRALGYEGDVNNATLLRSAVLAGGSGDGGDGWFQTDADGGVAASALDYWGPETAVGDVAVGPSITGSVVTPPDCPCPMPALFAARRIRHDGQLLYTGGWVLDDSAVYEDSCTVLVSEGPNELFGAAPAAGRERVTHRAERARSRFGAAVFDGEMGPDMLRFLPPGLREGRRLASLGAAARASVGTDLRIPAVDGPTPAGGRSMHCLVAGLDCPLVQLVDADDHTPAQKRAAFTETLDLLVVVPGRG